MNTHINTHTYTNTQQTHYKKRKEKKILTLKFIEINVLFHIYEKGLLFYIFMPGTHQLLIGLLLFILCTFFKMTINNVVFINLNADGKIIL